MTMTMFSKLDIKKLFSFLFCQGTPLLALTGTANKKTIKNIAKMLAVQKEHLLINVSPARSNIRFSVKCTKREKELGELAWLVTMLKENGLATPKTIIFCGTMKDMSAVYGELMSKLGEAAYVANKPRSPQNRLIGIYHSMTWKKYKSRVFESFKEDNGNIRVVLASSALSMGVNFPDVKYVIHMGPARTVVDHIQEAGRAGRNGELAHNIIVYHGNKIAECEKAIKQFVQSQDCLRKALYKQFDENIQSTTPPHDCCSVCSKACTCSEDKCAAAILPFEMCIEPQGNVVQALTRTVDEEEKSTLYNALKEYQGSLSSGSALLFDSNSTHGFSDELILDITKNCPSIFTIDDVQSKLPVFSLEHAKNILIIMQEIFEDIPLWHDFPESMDIIQDMFNDTSCDIFSEYFDLSSDNEDPDVNNTDELENL